MRAQQCEYIPVRGYEYDAVPTGNPPLVAVPRYLRIDMITTILGISKLSFNICGKKHGTPGDGGQNRFDTICQVPGIQQYEYVVHIESFDTISNTQDTSSSIRHSYFRTCS